MDMENNVSPHTENVYRMLNALVQHLRQDVEKLENPQEKAIFEVSAEVMTGLMKAFDDFKKKNEPAWQ
jgi:hypothetical protein